ncbi:hypothetical protein GALMADRAFT_770135 [Galerina marginata CBS 339.88]|uniref:Uncharacterized protein n=1 Tax=Galerina marginata (strain CBS 339.88) TaxID=685588 RepID=A0A067SXE8_GALM3|nr:hypothetical protein GALMADRAFT_770135 [Galerina marginata CBS 339.88]
MLTRTPLSNPFSGSIARAASSERPMHLATPPGLRSAPDTTSSATATTTATAPPLTNRFAGGACSAEFSGLVCGFLAHIGSGTSSSELVSWAEQARDPQHTALE